MEREVGGGIGMGNTCKSMADTFQCMTKPTTIKKKKKKKRWQEYTELYKVNLHNPDNYNFVITHVEPDILECEV